MSITNSFINYYYQIGLNTSTIISFLKNSNYKTSFFNNNTFNPEVIDCYISKNSPQKEVPFNESLLLKLCFPNNIKIQNSQLGIVEPEFFHFSIENSNDRNKSTYFSCLLVYENLSDLIDLNNSDLLIKKRNKIRISIEENSKSNEKNENYNSSCLINNYNQTNIKDKDNTQDTKASKCKYKYEKIRSSISLGDNNLFINSNEENEEKTIISVFSNSKFILFPKVILFGLNDMFNIDLKSILYDLYYKILKKSSFFSYELHVYYLLNKILYPPKGKYSIKFSIFNKEYTIQNTKFNDFSLINQELNMTFKYFNVNDIVEIYKYVLLEYNVLFFSKKISVLSQFSYSFLSFLHPFTYSLDKYPILHQSYFSVLQNMNGGLFGVNLSYYDCFFSDHSINIDEIKRNCLVVDIDKSNLIYFSVKQNSVFSLKNLNSQFLSIQPTNPNQSYKTNQFQSNSQSQVPDFPMKYKSKMIIRLKEYVRKCIINNYRSTLKVKDPKKLSDYKDFLKNIIKRIQIDYIIDSELPSVVASVILKIIFTYFNASLLKSYRNHMKDMKEIDNNQEYSDCKPNENNQHPNERKKKKGSGDQFNTSSVKYSSFINSINKEVSINDDLLLNSITKNKNNNKNSLNLSINNSNQSSIGTHTRTYNKTLMNKDISSKTTSNQMQKNHNFERKFNKKEFLIMNNTVHGQSSDWFYYELVTTKAFEDFIIGRRVFKSKSHLLDVVLFDEVISIKENKSLLSSQPITSFLDCDRFDFEEIVRVDCIEKVFSLEVDFDDCRFNDKRFEYDVVVNNDLKEDDGNDDSQNESESSEGNERNERNINRKTEKKKESLVNYRYSKSKTETFPENDSILMIFHEENEGNEENKKTINSKKSKKARNTRKTLLKYKFTYYNIPILSDIDSFLTVTNIEETRKNYNEEVEEVLDLVLSHKYFEKYINTSNHKVSIENYIYESYYLLLIKSFQFNAETNKTQENNTIFLVILSFLQLLQSRKSDFPLEFITNDHKEKDNLSINILDTVFNYIYLYGSIDMLVKLFNSYMNNSYNTSLHFMLLVEKIEKTTDFRGNSEEEAVEKMKIHLKDKENESFIYTSCNFYAQLYNSIQIRKFEEFHTKSNVASTEDCNLLTSKDLDFKVISTYPDQSAKKTKENKLKKEKNNKNPIINEEIEEEINIFTNFVCIECEKYVDLLLNCMNNDNLYNEIIWMKCSNCKNMVLPKIYIIINKKEAKESKESKESSFNEHIEKTYIYSPLFIYNTIINELFRIGNSSLNSLFDLKNKYSFLFWNAIWYLKLLDLPFFFIVPIKNNNKLCLSNDNVNDVKKGRTFFEISSFSFELT